MIDKGKIYCKTEGSMLGDALRALAYLQPTKVEVIVEILQTLRFNVMPRPEPVVTTKLSDDDLPKAEPDIDESPGMTAPHLVSDTDRLPSIINSGLEEISDAGAPPPEWLDKAPLIPLPITVPNPFKHYSHPLFEPKWQRAIITRLASVSLPLGQLDLERVVTSIASGRPLMHVPRRQVPTTAKGLQLLLDEGESMEPFRFDLMELTRAFMRIVGSARVSIHAFRGLPDWGCYSGLDWMEYVPPTSGVPIVVVSDLGLVPHGATAIRSSLSDWHNFFSRLKKSRTRCIAIVPRDDLNTPLNLSRQVQLLPWSRRTLASRLDRVPPIIKNSSEDKDVTSEPGVTALSEVARVSRHALEIACLGSLAARIEPQLLRALRLKLSPGAPVTAEAELWFSGLVAERAATGIILDSRYRETLQRLLRRDRERLDSAYAVIEEMHRDSAPALRIEEELCYRWLAGEVDKARSLLRSLVATIVAPQRTGVSKWASQALVRLPSGLMSLEEAQMLALGTALRTGETITLEKAGAGGGNAWHWLQPQSRMLELGVNLRQGMIEFGPRSMKASHRITVPDSNPVLLEIVTEGRVERIRLNPTVRTVVDIKGVSFEISIIGGGRWRLFETGSAKSSQNFIARNRVPRVQIEYDVEVYGALKKIQLPFVMGVLADLSGNPAEPLPSVDERRFIDVDLDRFDSFIQSIKPRVSFQVPNTLGDNEQNINVAILFESLEDFSPAGVARKVDILNDVLGERQQLSNLLISMDGNSGAEDLVIKVINDQRLVQKLISEDIHPFRERQGFTLDGEELAGLLYKEFKPKNEHSLSFIEQALRTLAKYVIAQSLSSDNDLVKLIESIAAEIDRKLSDQINAILHHEDFQKLEGAWRGLHYLISNTETDEMLKIRVLNISKKDLGRTLKKYKGVEWDQSPIFKKIYEEEYGQFGGEPFGCLIGDYYFDHGPGDIELLGEMSRIAVAAHAPFITGAAPMLLNLSAWEELANPRDLTKFILTPDYAAWRSLRESEDSLYIGLTMPRFLSRLPYGEKTYPVEEFDFEEDLEYSGLDSYTWSNSAYAMGANINRAFKLYGWCSRIRGVESGGAVEGLPVHTFPADDGGIDMKCPTEIAISDRREAELARIGLMPLLHKKNTDFAAFIGAQSLHKPLEYDDPDATANANLAARLPYLFAACRFAHYLKCIVRDKIGSFRERDDMEKWLNQWISNYVHENPEAASEEVKAKKPLAAAEIVLEEVSGNPGYYSAKFFLKPAYQLEGLTVSLRLVSRLPSSMTR